MDFSRDFTEKVASGSVVVAFISITCIILYASVNGKDLDAHDKYIFAVWGFVASEMKSLTINRGNGDRDSNKKDGREF